MEAVKATKSLDGSTEATREQLAMLLIAYSRNDRVNPGGNEVTVITTGADPMTGKMAVPPLTFGLDDMARWRADVLAGPVNVPLGWRDPADAVLCVARQQREQRSGERHIRKEVGGEVGPVPWPRRAAPAPPAPSRLQPASPRRRSQAAAPPPHHGRAGHPGRRMVGSPPALGCTRWPGT